MQRAKKAPTLNAEAWGPHKDRILQLHIEEGRSLKEVAYIMEQESGFIANERQYRTRITQWKKDKNVKPCEMQAIVRKRQFRKLVETDKLPQRFEVRQKAVPNEQIDRWMKRTNVSDTELYDPEMEIDTPSAVMCRTISSPGHSVLSPASSHSHALQSPTLTPHIQPLMHESPLGTVLQNHQSPGSISLSEVIDSPLGSFTGMSPAMEEREASFRHFDETAWQSPLTQDFQAVSGVTTRRYSPLEHVMSTYIDSRYRAAEEKQLIQMLIKYETGGHQSTEEYLMCMVDLGQVLGLQARYNTATAVLIYSVHSSQQGPTPQTRSIKVALMRLGNIFVLQVRHKRAELAFRKALSLEIKDATEHDVDCQLETMALLARTCYIRDKQKEAMSLSHQVLQACAGSSDGNHSRSRALMIAIEGLVHRCRLSQNLKEAEQLAEPLLRIARDEPQNFRIELLWIVHTIGLLYRLQKRQAETIQMFQRMITGLETVFGNRHQYTLMSMEYLAFWYMCAGNMSAAENLLRYVVNSYRALYGAQHPTTSAATSGLAIILVQQNKWQEANELGEKALNNSNKVRGTRHIRTVESMANLGFVYHKQQRSDEAYPLLRVATDILRSNLHCDEFCLHRTVKSLLEICHEQGRWDEIERLQRVEDGISAYRRL